MGRSGVREKEWGEIESECIVHMYKAFETAIRFYFWEGGETVIGM